ncbi:zinc ribbon domain-containing protein [Acholeplasma sp. OttesenSCG-928-E16]|nr:zinc ribbon domain-containing protein [Acholeplasma sp. OttesenSCG-928-E16]
MEDKRKEHDLHEQKGTKKKLKVIGLVLIIVGAIFTITGFVEFFIAISNLDSMEGPKLFWMLFIGLPMLGIGFSLFMMAYRGKIARYVASESAPVAKDVTNYMIDETKDSIIGVVNEIKNNKGASKPTKRACLKCGAINEIDQNFCGHCGAPLKENDK